MRKFLCKIGLHNMTPVVKDSEQFKKRGLLYTMQLHWCKRCNHEDWRIIERHNTLEVINTIPVDNVIREHLDICYGVDDSDYEDGDDFNLNLGLEDDEIQELFFWVEALYEINMNIGIREEITTLKKLVKYIENER